MKPEHFRIKNLNSPSQLKVNAQDWIGNKLHKRIFYNHIIFHMYGCVKRVIRRWHFKVLYGLVSKRHVGRFDLCNHTLFHLQQCKSLFPHPIDVVQVLNNITDILDMGFYGVAVRVIDMEDVEDDAEYSQSPFCRLQLP